MVQSPRILSERHLMAARSSKVASLQNEANVHDLTVIAEIAFDAVMDAEVAGKCFLRSIANMRTSCAFE
jgi:hypothetical protein